MLMLGSLALLQYLQREPFLFLFSCPMMYVFDVLQNCSNRCLRCLRWGKVGWQMGSNCCSINRHVVLPAMSVHSVFSVLMSA